MSIHSVIQPFSHSFIHPFIHSPQPAALNKRFSQVYVIEGTYFKHVLLLFLLLLIPFSKANLLISSSFLFFPYFPFSFSLFTVISFIVVCSFTTRLFACAINLQLDFLFSYFFLLSPSLSFSYSFLALHTFSAFSPYSSIDSQSFALLAISASSLSFLLRYNGLAFSCRRDLLLVQHQSTTYS